MSFWSDLCSGARGNIRECMTTPLTKKKILIIGGIALVVIIIIIIIAVSVNQNSGSGGESKGSDVIKKYPFVIGGNELSEFVKKTYHNQINKEALDKVLANVQASADILNKGHVSTLVWNIGASDCSKAQYHDAVTQTLEQIDVIQRIVKQVKTFTLVSDASALQKVKDSKEIGGILRVDGGYALDAKLSLIRTYYNLGVRILAIGGKCDNPWSKTSAKSSDPKVPDGLQPFGQKVINEMSRLGMIIDISGATEKTQLDILDAATTLKTPVLLSHSGYSAVAADPDNVGDKVLEKLKANEGLLMVSLKESQICSAETQGGTCTLPLIMETLTKLRDKLGENSIGIGANFGDKDAKTPAVLDTPEKLVNLFDSLFKPANKTSGVIWNKNQLQKLAGGNLINFFKKVNEMATRKVEDKPIEDLIDKSVYDTHKDCYTDTDEMYPPSPPK